MSSSESDSSVVAEDEDEEQQLYQLIFEINTRDDKEENEVQSPGGCGSTPLHRDRTTCETTRARGQEVQDNNKANQPDIGILDNIQGISIPKVNVAEKPWMKAGADISDYFNYGFDEESWITYCKKQSKLRAAYGFPYFKIMSQRGHTRYEERVSSTLASRPSSATIKATGRRHGPGSSVDRHQYPSVEGNNSQVNTEMSHEEKRITSYPLSPPPSFLYRQGLLPPSCFAALDSEQPKGLYEPSTSLHPCSSGVSSSVPRRMSSRAGMIDAARAWEHLIRLRMCERDRDRSREYGCDKRGSDIYTERCFFSQNSEERMRHRDTMERGHKHHSLERFSRENKEQRQKRRHRDKRERQQKSSYSSSSRSSRSSRSSKSRKDSVEDRDSQSRHNHKKAKRNEKRNKRSKMLSADPKRKLILD